MQFELDGDLSSLAIVVVHEIQLDLLQNDLIFALAAPAILAPPGRHASGLVDFGLVPVPQAGRRDVAHEVELPFEMEYGKVLGQTLVVVQRVDGLADDFSVLVLERLVDPGGVPLSASHSEPFIHIFPGMAG